MQKSAILALALLAIVASVMGGGGGKGGWKKGGGKHMQCKGQAMTKPPHKDAFMSCKEKMPWGKGKKNGGEDGGEKKDKMCGMAEFKACLWEAIGIVKDGKLSNDAVEKFYQEMYPGEVGNGLGKFMVEKCITEDNTKDLGNTDKCVGYKSLVMCMFKNHHEYCQGSEGGKKGKTSASDEE